MLHVMQIARICHEANRAYCVALGDLSQPSWDEAPDWQRDSAIKGVKLHLADPTTTPEQSHDNWCRQKFEEGWAYGPAKDPATRQHPCLKPYELLPEEQRRKDSLFKSVIDALR